MNTEFEERLARLEVRERVTFIVLGSVLAWHVARDPEFIEHIEDAVADLSADAENPFIAAVQEDLRRMIEVARSCVSVRPQGGAL